MIFVVAIKLRYFQLHSRALKNQTKLSKVFLKKRLRFYFKKLGKINKAPVVTEMLGEVPNCNPEISMFIKKKWM